MKRFDRSFPFGLLLVFPASAFASTVGGAPQTVFQCSFGAKEASVTRVGSTYVYKHGSPFHTEIEVVGDPSHNNVFVGGLTGSSGGGTTYIRIANGRYSYVVFWSGDGWDYGTEKAVKESGLAAFDGTKKLSQAACKSGIGFRSGWNRSSEPPLDPRSDEITDALGF